MWQIPLWNLTEPITIDLPTLAAAAASISQPRAGLCPARAHQVGATCRYAGGRNRSVAVECEGLASPHTTLLRCPAMPRCAIWDGEGWQPLPDSMLPNGVLRCSRRRLGVIAATVDAVEGSVITLTEAGDEGSDRPQRLWLWLMVITTVVYSAFAVALVVVGCMRRRDAPAYLR